MWDAIKDVRARRPLPAERFDGLSPAEGPIDVAGLEAIVGAIATVNATVIKLAVPREGTMHGTTVRCLASLKSRSDRIFDVQLNVFHRGRDALASLALA